MKFKWKLMFFYGVSIIGLFIYLKGFFPIKVASPGFTTLEDVPPAPRDSQILLQLSSEEFVGNGEKSWQHSESLPQNYTKLVLIIIDALREDFVFGGKHLHGTPFLRQLITEGNAAGFVAQAHAPTVTMPRLKAITTGSIPGYVDVILNLDQTKELKEDNIIRSSSADGRSIIFFGDDTWIKLFPGKFKRQDGTTSFFVKDYTIVDNNVTRHLDKELSHASNFDFMILHYLGLDHIGHIAGPKSPLIDVKLKEMDFVIKQIYQSLEKHDAEKSSKSLIVVTGDHGMTDKGSHGGTTIPERNVPLVFLAPKINEKAKVRDVPSDVEQTDLAVTLSLLFGLPIPRGSMGKSIVPMIQLLSKEDQLHAMQYNCHHLLRLSAQSGSLSQRSNEIIDPVQIYRNALISHATWMKHPNTADKEFALAKQGYTVCQQALSETLVSNVATYNNSELGAGMVIVWLGYLAVILLWGQVVLTQPRPQGAADNSPNSPLTWGVLATIGTILHAISLLSSSFLEEEHQTWYFITLTFLLILFTSISTEIAGMHLGMSENLRGGFFSPKKDSSLPVYKEESAVLLKRSKSNDSTDSTWDFVELDQDKEPPATNRPGMARNKVSTADLKTLGIAISTLVVHRLLRGWNQTGIQFADLPDIGDWLNDPDHKLVLSIALILGLVCTAILLETLTVTRDPWRRYLSWCGLGLVYCYRASTGQVSGFSDRSDDSLTEEQSLGLIPARLLYFVIVVILGRLVFLKSRIGPKLKMVVKAMDYIISCVILLGAVLLRPHNVWALVFNLFLYWSVFRQLWPIMNETDHFHYDSSIQLGKIVLRTTLCYWFGQMSYFSMGNSNSLASIDVSAGYVGIPSHTGSLEDSVVIFLLIFTTYIGPIVWTMLCLSDTVEVTSKESKVAKSESSTELLAVFSTLAFLRLTPMAFYLILVTAMRYHLFIWSVFAPKLLYETASTLIYGSMLLEACAAANWIA